MKSLALIILLMVVAACNVKTVQLQVTNDTNHDRLTETVEVPLTVIRQHTNTPNEDNNIAVADEHGNVLPTQVTHDNMLLFQTALKANESKQFVIVTGVAAKYVPKVAGRLYPERYDDFAWENDKVAFRLYGKALIQKDGPSNGLDVIYKRTEPLVLDKWFKLYTEEGLSYHDDHGEGQDAYDVKRSLGAGAMAPYTNDTLWLNDNFANYEILDNGPIRITFKLQYDSFNVAGQTVTETRTISLDAGSQLTRITQYFNSDKELKVAAGIVKRSDTTKVIYADHYVVATEPLHPTAGHAYIAVVLPDGIKEVKEDAYTTWHVPSKNNVTYQHTLAVTTQLPQQNITYYAGYGWEKAGFPTVESFEGYVKQFTSQLQTPLTVTIK